MFTPADRRQRTNMLWNGLSLNTRFEEKYAWGTSYDTKSRQTESGFTLSFQTSNGSEEQLFASSSGSFSAFQTASGFSAGKSNIQLPSKGWYLHFFTGGHLVYGSSRSLLFFSLVIWKWVKYLGRCGRILGSPPWISRFPPCSLSSVNLFGSPGPATFITFFIWWCTKIDEQVMWSL